MMRRVHFTSILIGLGLTFILQTPQVMAVPSAFDKRGAHPGFTISTIPALGNISTMGLEFLANGDLVWLHSQDQYINPPGPNAQAGVWLISNIATNPTSKKIADQFREPTGIAVGANEELMVADLDGVYKVTNLNPANPSANKTLVLAAPPTTPAIPYHAYIFGPIYHNGTYYAPYSGTFISGGFANSNPNGPYSGALLAWKSDGAGGFTKFAGGLRSPNGAGKGPNGLMVFTDNQGSWNPSCSFNIIKQDKFYGSHQTSGYTDNWAGIANKAGTLPYQPPAAWMLQSIAVGATYGIGESTAQPLYMDHGPYQGDWIVGDCTQEGIARVSLDPVNGGNGPTADYNGSVEWFTSGLATNGTVPCPNRLAMDPKLNTIYVGTLGPVGQSAGAWPDGNTPQPFYKIALDSAAIHASFEILAVHSRANGIEVVFSQPVSTASALAGSFSLHQWDLKRQDGYGSGNNATTPPTISAVQVSTDHKRVFLQIGNHAAVDRVLAITASGVRSETGNSTLVYNQAWFTHNYQSTVAFNQATTEIAHHQVDKFMQDRISQTMLANGLHVQVDLKGAYSISLSALNGTRMVAQEGFNPGNFAFGAPGRGLFILHVRQGEHEYVRPIAFK